MKHVFARSSAIAVLAASVLGTAVSAQANVVINEVLYDPAGPDAGKEIIEIANLGTSAQSLSGWALCIGFTNPFARVYWNFPAGTSVPAGGFVQVRWQTTGVSTATEIFTGTPASGTCFNPMMPLDDAVGSVALYQSQGCAGFGAAGNIVDFVQWGGGPTFRAAVAVSASIWPAMSAAAPDVAEGSSLAYDGSGDTPGDYFELPCPTPGGPNGNATAASFGAGCAGAAGTPQIVTTGGLPVLGNRSFALNVNNAPAGAPSVLFVGAPPGISVPLLGCNVLVLPLITVPFTVGPDFPLPVQCNPRLIGGTLLCQWFILDPGGPMGLSASDGLSITF